MEILVVLLVIVAIFLLVERMSIRETLLAWAQQAGKGVAAWVLTTGQAVASRLKQTTLSDLTAYLLIAVVAGLVAWRTRQRALSHPRWTVIQCPKCGSELHRIHRHTADRLLSLVVPVRRYQCKNHDCRWRGLRVRRSHHP